MKHKCYMLDTNVCAFWLRDKYGVKDHVNAVGMENCYISEVTVAETVHKSLHHGVEIGKGEVVR